MKIDALRRDWDELAEEDPLYAILSDDARNRGGHWELDEFFATGEREIERVLAQAGALDRPRSRERALDFGCGVGRLTRALAATFDEAVGVDISPVMVERAQRLNADRPNMVFETNVAPDLRLFADSSFDFVYSSKVLQHVPTAHLACTYVREFVRVARPGGLVVFQLWTRLPWRNRLQPRRRLHGLLRSSGVPRSALRSLRLSPMGRGIAVPETRIRAAVEGHGGRVLSTEPDGEWGLVYYLAPPEATSSE
jgi:SAM-dependent methyltransferase